jgi:hypothetical protein
MTSPSQIPDYQLLQRAQKGDEAAFRLLFERHRDRLYRLALMILAVRLGYFTCELVANRCTYCTIYLTNGLMSACLVNQQGWIWTQCPTQK